MPNSQNRQCTPQNWLGACIRTRNTERNSRVEMARRSRQRTRECRALMRHWKRRVHNHASAMNDSKAKVNVDISKGPLAGNSTKKKTPTLRHLSTQPRAIFVHAQRVKCRRSRIRNAKMPDQNWFSLASYVYSPR